MLHLIKISPKLFACFVLFAATMFYSQIAHAGKCPNSSCDRGALCFSDWSSDGASDGYSGYSCGKVYGSNSNWSAFNWNNRADGFYNNGSSYNACLYNGTGSTRFAAYVYRAVINVASPYYNGSRNTVSSNRWTRAGCP